MPEGNMALPQSESRDWPSDRALTEGGAVFSLIGIAGVGVPMLWPDERALGIAFIVFGFGGALLIASLAIKRILARSGIKPAMILVSVGTSLILIGSLVGLIGAFKIDGGAIRARAEGPTDPTDLFYYFVHDFNFMSIDRTALIRMQGPSDLDQTVEVKIRLFRDFGGNSEFMAVFVPIFSDVRLAANTEPFIENLKPQIKQAREDAKLIGVKSSSPGVPVSSSEDLVFSGRVFLYTLNSLDPIQTGHLVESFRKDGMYLEIRGGDYLFYRNQQRH
jgi:hypothetical protein